LQGVNSKFYLSSDLTTGLEMEGVEAWKIQSLNIKNNDDITDKNLSKTAAVQAPSKWLELIDADGKKRRAKRFAFKDFPRRFLTQYFYMNCRAVACVINSNFKGIKINQHVMERIGSLQDVDQIKTTCANLTIGLNEHDIIQNQKRDTILNKIETFGACKEGNGSFIWT
jgi:hypothetical protein